MKRHAMRRHAMSGARRSWLIACAATLLVASIASHAADDRARAGGETTVFDEGPTAYGRALANLQPSRWSELAAGKARFVRSWPRRGPWADAASCADCHFRDGRGPRPESDAAHAGLSHLLRLGRSSGGADPVYGAQLRRIAIEPGVPAPGQFNLRWDEIGGRYPSGERYVLRRPRVDVTQLAHGPLARSTRLSLRVPPAVFGLGLIDAIPERDIIAHADPADKNGDGISGRAQLIPDAVAVTGTRAGAGLGTGTGTGTGNTILGRFGWKAARPSLDAQSATALQEDLGVTAPEDHELRSLVDYLRALAVPARRRWTEPVVMRGEALFARIGCGDCHRSPITTGHLPGWPELSGQTIQPFTDLLLHDMGSELADGVREGMASGSEWRTPPLWGLGLLPAISGEMRLLHDGRARSIEEAILWHGGEAERARRRFVALPKAERDALTTFIATL